MSDSPAPMRFPFSRTSPPATPGGARELGVGAQARLVGLDRDHLNGHWCSRCEGIWYGLLLEVQCPVCGNRNG